MRFKEKMLLLAASLLLLLWIERSISKRPDVLTTTAWHAPVIWEGTFNRRVLDDYYRTRNVTVGLVVFAAGRFVDEYLELFVRSADKHFMVGYKVIFYVMVDVLFSVPYMKLGPRRTFKAFKIPEDDWWPDLSLARMRSLGEHSRSPIEDEADFLLSMAVNQVFQNDFGVETLGQSVAQLHAWWYFKNTPKSENFPERRPVWAACTPEGQGDYSYSGAILGAPPQLLHLVDEYLKDADHDALYRLNSTCESHLNKYFFLKPTKLLSPEYNWDPRFRLPKQIQCVKVAWQSHTF
ncbi:LOW QUALITY PROTEIN: putative glycosyltransferase 6 domain-containing protein 1 [Rhynchocyon petersi]